MAPVPPRRAEAPPGARTLDDTDESAADALRRAGRGDASALMWLYDRYAPTLLAVAVRVTGNRAEGEEVFQDAMIRAWLEAPAYDPARGTAVAWLVALTRNRAIDVVRARARRTLHEATAMREAAFDGTAPGPERAASDAQGASAVQNALDALTVEQRKTLELAYYGGLSHSEIAERLRQPLGTVKTRIAQAVRRLREAFSRNG